jgi:hypothetical protein
MAAREERGRGGRGTVIKVNFRVMNRLEIRDTGPYQSRVGKQFVDQSRKELANSSVDQSRNRLVGRNCRLFQDRPANRNNRPV